jgi:hypothetical protein
MLQVMPMKSSYLGKSATHGLALGTRSRQSRNQTGQEQTTQNLSHAGKFWMFCRFTSARVVPADAGAINISLWDQAS